MPKLFTLIYGVTLFLSCGGQDSFVQNRLKTCDKFIRCLQDNTPDKILDFTYHGVSDNIDDKESRDFYVNKAHDLINRFGLPPKDKWVIKYDPKNNFERLTITIPIFKGYDSTVNLLKADLVIYFPPPQISDKVYKYEIEDTHKIQPLTPVPVDTTKRNH